MKGVPPGSLFGTIQRALLNLVRTVLYAVVILSFRAEDDLLASHYPGFVRLSGVEIQIIVQPIYFISNYRGTNIWLLLMIAIEENGIPTFCPRALQRVGTNEDVSPVR